MQIRPIIPADEVAMAALIRSVMTEYGACGEGFSIMDYEVDHMEEAYRADGCKYYVIEEDGNIVGGAGIAPVEGGDGTVCELKKMYFHQSARGKGLGKALAEQLVADAKLHGYKGVYIETLNSMTTANALYKKLGFKPLTKNMGNTGHTGCDAFYYLQF